MIAAAAAGAIAALIIRDQVTRHQRDLFSPRVLRRLAALGHVNNVQASVNTIRMLRDFVAWEPRRMLRERAQSIVSRMEEEVAKAGLLAETEGL